MKPACRSSAALYLEYPEQEPAYTFQQQYLFGKDLLVAPITAPGQRQTGAEGSLSARRPGLV